MGRDIVQRIQHFNQGRHPELLAIKYQRMQQDVFAFFRGTCHLFYQDCLAQGGAGDPVFNQAPPVWICGDLHLENFGSYKGSETAAQTGSRRPVYFDLNDFDEAVLAPCTWDLARFLTSVLVAAYALGIDLNDAEALCANYLTTYTTTLAKGQAGMVSCDRSTGLVKNLLQNLKHRRRKDFLQSRTEKIGKIRRLRTDGQKAAPVTPEQREKIIALVEAWAASQRKPSFFHGLDVAYRIAGTSSLGLDRYILLIEGKGSPNRNYLLDLKAACPSALQPYLTLPQPTWENEAERIVAIQQRVQWAAPALLTSIELDGKPFILKELQPTADRVNLAAWNGKLKRLRKVIETMAEITAWGQLRSSGRQGAAIADSLIAFAHQTKWQVPLLEYARSYALQVKADHREFVRDSPLLAENLLR